MNRIIQGLVRLRESHDSPCQSDDVKFLESLVRRMHEIMETLLEEKEQYELQF